MPRQRDAAPFREGRVRPPKSVKRTCWRPTPRTAVHDVTGGIHDMDDHAQLRSSSCSGHLHEHDMPLTDTRVPDHEHTTTNGIQSRCYMHSDRSDCTRMTCVYQSFRKGRRIGHSCAVMTPDTPAPRDPHVSTVRAHLQAGSCLWLCSSTQHADTRASVWHVDLLLGSMSLCEG